MKNFSMLVLALCIFSAVGAFGQVNFGSAMTAPEEGFQMADHAATASRTPLGREIDLLEVSQTTVSQGEIPLWEAMEMMPPRPVTPLGDLARAIRKEHALAPKAVMVWNN
jgi:hypothetical protein